MNCLDRIALTQYLRGKLEPEKLLEVSEHVFSCEQCRRSLKSLENYAPAAAYVRDAAFGVTECPEYEELSAFVDGALAAGRLAYVEAHASQCDFCKSDVETMRALRARAELAEPVIASPVKIRRGLSLTLFPVWQKAVAGTALAAVVAGVIFLASHQPVKQPTVAVNPDKAKPQITKPEGVKPEPEKIASNTGLENTRPGPEAPVTSSQKPKPENVVVAPETVIIPRPTVEERIDLASLNIDDSLEARLERAIEQKRKSGSTQVDKPVMVALLDTADRVRAKESVEFAPTPVSPAMGVFRNSPKALRWKPVEEAGGYRVMLQDDQGNTIYHETVEDSQFVLPQKLERGKTYLWFVQSKMGPGDWRSSKATVFRLISDDEAEALEKAEAKFAGHPDILGTVYESFGLYDEAVRQFQKYAAANPSKLSKKMLHEANEKKRALIE